MFRNFCFTLNNYSLEDPTNIWKDERFKYVIFGYEVAPETGTPHLQGYAELVKRTRFDTVRLMYPGWHIEHRRGSQREAIEYCKKSKNFVERGEKAEQGVRGDLDGIRVAVAEDGMRYVCRWANFQQIRVAEKYLTYAEEARNWKPEVMWLWGESGAGKSKLARELLNMEDCYVKNNGSKWWDGYDGHSDIILDDFRSNWFDGDFTYLLGLLDRYEFRTEVKGGFRQIRARRIIITSIDPPEKMYMYINEPIEQLLRRIDSINYVQKPVPEVGGVILNPPLEQEMWSKEDCEIVLKMLNELSI